MQTIPVGLERNIMLKAHDVMWDWKTFINPFLDVTTLNEVVGRCWNHAQRELGFPNLADTTPASSDLLCCP